MSKQAEENIEIEEAETVEVEEVEQEEAELQTAEPGQTEAESEEDEIILDGEEQPSSKPVPKGFLKRINKLNERVETANSETEQERRRREMLEEENRLLKAKLTGGTREPKPEDFDTDEEYEAERRKFTQAQIQAAARAETQRLYEEGQRQNTQRVNADQERERLSKHYERAEALRVSDYEQAEDKAIDVLGKSAARHIMANTDKSEILMYYLGKNPARAEALASKIRTNPIQGLVELGRLEEKLRIKPKTSTAPEPETELPPGGVVSSSKGTEGMKFE